MKQLLFPLRCPVCDQPVRPFGEKICPECFLKRAFLTAPYCMKCGKKVEEEEELCADCREKAHVFERGRALYEYDSVKLSIYRFKYGQRREYAGLFGEEMGYFLGDFIRDTGADALIPIPLHASRLRERGYNQAELLADALSGYTGIRVMKNYLLRTKNTTPLKYLNPLQRQNNLKKAFIIHRNDVKLKKVILVDDIYTTGSTIDEAARTLMGSGVEKVYFVALSCGAGI